MELAISSADALSWPRSIQELRQAISSRQPTLRPWRSSMASMKLPALISARLAAAGAAAQPDEELLEQLGQCDLTSVEFQCVQLNLQA